MNRILLTLPCLLALAACELSSTGSTVTNEGAAVSIVREKAALSEKFTLTSAEGWSCEGTANLGRGNVGITHTLPLTCSDGSTGSAQLTYASPLRGYQNNTAVQIEFKLSNGRSGKAAI